MSVALRAPRVLAGAVSLAIIAIALPAGPAHADRAAVCANAPANVFADVPSDSTHAANIDCIAAYGITVGVGGGNYDPGGWVSRGQMASFLVNFVEMATDTPAAAPSAAPFSDISGTTHATNIAIAADLGITSGRTPTTYEPAADVSRAQMASFVTHAIEAAGGSLARNVAGAFHDDDGSVHEDNINALAAAGVVNGTGRGAYDPDGFVTRAQMASFLANAAGWLYERGLWRASPLPVDGPQAVLVTRAGSTLDMIEVRWDRPVDVSASGAAFGVAVDADATDAIAVGTEVTHEGSVSSVELDTPLTVGEIYWLQIEGGAALDEDDHANGEQVIAFTFAVAGGDGSGDEGDGSDPVEPAIVSAVTDPANDQIVVSFDTAVVCPTTTGGAAAWSFSNSSVDTGDGHVTGLPDSVTQTDTPSTTCNLEYSADGVGVNDFGMLSYTQPPTASDRVQTGSGTPLPSTADVYVEDGVAPTFEGVAGSENSASLLLTFSEPIACSTVSTSQFTATINGTPVDVDATDCGAPASSTLVITVSSVVVSGQEVAVSVIEDTTLSDQSLDNQVPAATRSLTMP